MNKNINLKRLSLALQEFWLLNKTKILSIPFVILLMLTIYYLWYDMPLAKHYLFGLYPNKESFIADLTSAHGLRSRALILFVLPVYIVLCSQPYLNKLNTSVRTTITPFTRGERLLTLSLYGLFVTTLVVGSFFGVDALIVKLLRTNYLDQALLHMENQGYLYYTFGSNTYFEFLPREIFYVVAVSAVTLTPLYYLASLFFKKYSVVKFLLILIVFIVAIANLVPKIYQYVNGDNASYYGPVSQWGIYIFITLIVGLIITTTYYKLKEKEI